MRFALLGNHPDGLSMALALAATGRHSLTAYSGPAPAAASLRQRGLDFQLVGDLEEVLADPAVELVIVAGRPGHRALQLRRALQSERHVLCVHPADQTPDSAYEAALIQADTRQVLLPLLPDLRQAALRRLAELMRKSDGPVGKPELILLEYTAAGPVLLETGVPGFQPGLPCWSVLRYLGGEVAEVSAFAPGEHVEPDQPVLVSGRFESGGLFQVLLLPGRRCTGQKIRVHGTRGDAELTFDQPAGSATLTWRPQEGEPGTEAFHQCDTWAGIVETLEATLASPQSASQNPRAFTWQDEVRALELDDAARRSVERRRASALEYQEVSDAVGFKGTMTLVGCALLWGLLVLVILAAWKPWLLYLVIPVLLLFLALQLLRWVIPASRPPATGKGAESEAKERND